MQILDSLTQIRLDKVVKSQDGQPLNAIKAHLNMDDLEEFTTVQIFDMMLAWAIIDCSYEPFNHPHNPSAKLLEDRGLADLKYIQSQLSNAIKALEL